jgi:hypothetical protein
VDRVHESVDCERCRSTVDHGHRLGGGSSENDRNARPRARNLAAVEGKGRGDGGKPHRLQDGAADGRTRPGDGGEQSAEEALSGVDVADSEASN